jgi:hypothetical protein
MQTALGEGQRQRLAAVLAAVPQSHRVRTRWEVVHQTEQPREGEQRVGGIAELSSVQEIDGADHATISSSYVWQFIYLKDD